MPRAFFGTFFRFERKYCPPRGGSPTVRAGVGASNPHRQKRACTCGRTKGLSSGQTIGAVRTAVRSACCLPELRVANRLRRLYPLDTRFPSFPFGNLRGPKVAKKQRDCNHCSRGKAFAFGSEQRDFFGTNHRHSRAAVRPACGLPAEANTHPSRRRLHPPR